MSSLTSGRSLKYVPRKDRPTGATSRPAREKERILASVATHCYQRNLRSIYDSAMSSIEINHRPCDRSTHRPSNRYQESSCLGSPEPAESESWPRAAVETTGLNIRVMLCDIVICGRRAFRVDVEGMSEGRFTNRAVAQPGNFDRYVGGHSPQSVVSTFRCQGKLSFEYFIRNEKFGLSSPLSYDNKKEDQKIFRFLGRSMSFMRTYIECMKPE